MNKVQIAIADDQQLMRDFLSDYLSGQQDLSVSCVASDGADLLRQLDALQDVPDIFLLDMNMRGPQETEGTAGGEATIVAIRELFPEVKIIVLSTHYKKIFSGYMLNLGVAAFLPKDISPEALTQAVLDVHRQGYHLTLEQVQVMRDQISPRAPKPQLEETLTERELQVLRLICQEFTSSEIGEKLFLSRRTVEGHKEKLFMKTRARNIAGLVVYAHKHNLLEGY